MGTVAPQPAAVGGRWVDGGGNHRLLVEVESPAPTASVTFERRFRDPRPKESRGVLIVAVRDGRVVELWGTWEDEALRATCVFATESGPGLYALYVLPVDVAAPAHYPEDHHSELQNPDESWARSAVTSAVPARVLAWEHRSEHHRWDEMELRATPEEESAFLSRWPPGELVVLAGRAEQPLRLRTALPAAWAARAPGEPTVVTLRPGGRSVLQLAVWAARGEVDGLDIKVHSVEALGAEPVVSCMNFEAPRAPAPADPGPMGDHSLPGGPQRTIPAGELRALWCSVHAPPELPSGTYRVLVTVTAAQGAATVPVDVVVSTGAPESSALSPLLWLGSQRARSSGPTRAFSPVRASGARLEVLGRSVTLGQLGLPESVVSHFSDDLSSADGESTAVLSAPTHLRLIGTSGSELHLEGGAASLPGPHDDGFAWSASAVSGSVTVKVVGSLDFDGTLCYEVDLSTSSATDLLDVQLVLPLRTAVARYVMGLGQRGGLRKSPLDWSWDVQTRNQDAVWTGTHNAGLQLSLRDEHYRRPLNTNFYLRRPLVSPSSWDNGGRGYVRIADGPTEGTTTLVAGSGHRLLQAGEHVRYDFRIVITPFKPVSLSRHITRRYLHRYAAPEEVLADGANTVNLHHATPVNQYLNYPMLSAAQLERYCAHAHDLGVSVRLYDTIRELTTRAPELWAMLQFGDELFHAGPGGGQSWLREHMDPPYLPGWYAAEVDDTTLVTNKAERWDNFYVESLAWLAQHCRIDGLYLDDVAFDRDAIKRVRHVLEAGSRDPDIDLHSANQFNPKDGYASSANLYLELMPYLDRLWFGEYFDYAAPDDYWLVEVSGLPYGLTGEMLEGGGHPYRGMLYAMTSRLGFPGAEPRPIWDLWDRAETASAKMRGYWSANPVVATGRQDVLATAYVTSRRTLVALASWSQEDQDIALDVDWSGLGGHSHQLSLPEVSGLQEGAEVTGANVRVPAGKGAFVVLGQPLGPPGSSPAPVPPRDAPPGGPRPDRLL